MGKFKQVLGTFVVLLLLGCTSEGVKVDQSKLGGLRPGITTPADTIALLGQPTDRTINSDGTSSFQYTYTHSEPMPINFVPYVSALFSGQNSEDTTLTVNFDANGKLTTYTSVQGSSTKGTGLINGMKQ